MTGSGPGGDRVPSLGGPPRIADIEARLRVVQHISAGPIVRWGGHSQGFDALAGEIGAFFGRLIVPVDYVAGGEARRGEATRRVDPARAAHLRSWISAETGRIRGAHPAWWEAAGILLDDLDLGPEGLATERAQADEVGATPPGRLRGMNPEARRRRR